MLMRVSLFFSFGLDYKLEVALEALRLLWLRNTVSVLRKANMCSHTLRVQKFTHIHMTTTTSFFVREESNAIMISQFWSFQSMFTSLHFFWCSPKSSVEEGMQPSQVLFYRWSMWVLEKWRDQLRVTSYWAGMWPQVSVSPVPLGTQLTNSGSCS